MRRNSPWALLAALAVVGCGPSERVVTVRWEPQSTDWPLRMMPAAEVGVRERADLQTGPTAPPGSGAATGAISPSAIARQARSAVERNLARARRELREQLYRAYERSHDAWRAEQEEALRAEAVSARERADLAVSRLLREHAALRGPLLNRLAFLAGFPVPPRAAWPKIPEERKWDRKRRSEAEARLAGIETLDREYASATDALWEEAWAQVGRARLHYQLELVARMDAAAQRAESEAEATFREARAEWSSKLADAQLELGKAGAWPTVRFAKPSPVLPIAGRPTSTRRPIPLPESLSQLEIRIWAAQRGYKPNAAGIARDATEEFLRWKDTRHPGR